MKKLLAICSIFFTVCATFTGCGSSDERYMSNEKNHDSEPLTSSTAEGYVEDALDGIGEAGKDIIEGATNAADDIVEGFEGKDKHDNDKKTTSDRHKYSEKTSTTTTDRR